MPSLDDLLPEIAPYAKYLVNWYNQYAPLRISSVYRSYTDQLALWNNRATNRYPVAPPGRSYHQQRRAFDVNGPSELLHAMGATWTSWGGTWHPSDEIHFQA